MQSKLLCSLLLGSLAVCSCATAQVSISNGSVSLGGQITLPDGLAKAFGDIDNNTFKCSLVPIMRKYVLFRAKGGDTLPAMVSSDRAISTDTEAGYPVMAMIEAPDGNYRILIPAILAFKVDLEPGAKLFSNGFDIETTRSIKAGESIPVLYVGGQALLSTEASAITRGNGSPSEPAVRIFLGSSNRIAIVATWRVEKSLQ